MNPFQYQSYWKNNAVDKEDHHNKYMQVFLYHFIIISVFNR